MIEEASITTSEHWTNPSTNFYLRISDEVMIHLKYHDKEYNNNTFLVRGGPLTSFEFPEALTKATL